MKNLSGFLEISSMSETEMNQIKGGNEGHYEVDPVTGKIVWVDDNV